MPARGPSCTCTTSACSARSRSATATGRRAFAAAAPTRVPGLRLRCRGIGRRGGRVRGRAAPPAAARCSSTPTHRGPSAKRPARACTSWGCRASGHRARRTSSPRELRAESRAPIRATYALAVGRLVEEKGFDTAIPPRATRACRSDRRRGPRRGAAAARWPPAADVRFTGRLDADRLAEAARRGRGRCSCPRAGRSRVRTSRSTR